ncbi:hypothetical protein Tco_1419009 [Tanacetum coccineum]
MMVQAIEDMGEDSVLLTRKDSAPSEPTTEETPNEVHVSTPSYDPPQSGEDSIKGRLLCFKKERGSKQLSKERKLKTPRLKRLRKIGSTSRVESSNDTSLGAQEDASKQGRKVTDLDADAEVTLVDETQEMNDDNLMFDTGVLEEQEKDVAEKEVSAADPVTTAGILSAQEEKEQATQRHKKRNTMSTYLKTWLMQTQSLKSISYDEIQEMFDKEIKRQEKAKKQKGDDDQEEEEIKKHIEIVKDDEVAIDAIPLALKPLYFFNEIKMLQNIDREDLETLWKMVKAKHENTRPEDDYERVFWGDLKVMFEPDIKSEVWRSLQGYKVTVWKLFDSCGVHFVRFKDLHIFMLVEKRYPLTPITITNMLNKKLQADHWNEMCYQLLKLMTKQEKGQ